MMIPTLIAISIISFIIIQLPPGDFLTTYIVAAAGRGRLVDESEIEALEARYGLDQPMYMQYIKWMTNMTRGDFGYSMDWGALSAT